MSLIKIHKYVTDCEQLSYDIQHEDVGVHVVRIFKKHEGLFPANQIPEGMDEALYNSMMMLAILLYDGKYIRLDLYDSINMGYSIDDTKIVYGVVKGADNNCRCVLVLDQSEFNKVFEVDDLRSVKRKKYTIFNVKEVV